MVKASHGKPESFQGSCSFVVITLPTGRIKIRLCVITAYTFRSDVVYLHVCYDHLSATIGAMAIVFFKYCLTVDFAHCLPGNLSREV